jgi:D-glycero-D-manno-heptose 1,7-bisphosphate phosphatase
MSSRIVFLDRDGTVNRKAPHGEYIERADQLELLPSAAEGIRSLQKAGFLVILVTNQRGVALGIMTESAVAAVHSALSDLLRKAGVKEFDDIRMCPHDLGECTCRKPQPGMLLDSLAKHNGDPAASFIIGDAHSDVAAGLAAGVTPIRLSPRPDPLAHITCLNLNAAATWILVHSGVVSR